MAPEAGRLTPDTPLSGLFVETEAAADLDAVLREISAAEADEARRQAALEAADVPAQREEPPPPWLQ